MINISVGFEQSGTRSAQELAHRFAEWLTSEGLKQFCESNGLELENPGSYTWQSDIAGEKFSSWQERITVDIVPDWEQVAKLYNYDEYDDE